MAEQQNTFARAVLSSIPYGVINHHIVHMLETQPAVAMDMGGLRHQACILPNQSKFEEKNPPFFLDMFRHKHTELCSKQAQCLTGMFLESSPITKKRVQPPMISDLVLFPLWLQCGFIKSPSHMAVHSLSVSSDSSLPAGEPLSAGAAGLCQSAVIHSFNSRKSPAC